MTPDLDTFAARLQAAESQYTASPADAARLADEAIALLGTPAPVRERLRAMKVKGHALLLGARFVDGLATLQQALAEVPDDAPDLRVDLLRGVSAAYEQMGDLPQALDWGLRAAEAARALGHRGRLADTLLSIGVVRSRSGDHASGLAHYEEAFAAYEAGNERRLMHGALCNMGIACKNLGRLEDAVRHLQRSIDLARELGDEGLEAMSLANIGEPLWKLGRLAQALEASTLAAARLQRAGIPGGECLARILRGQVLQELGDLGAAQAELEQALALTRASAGAHLARAHLALAVLHKHGGRFEAALLHHEAYHAAERAQFNETSARSLNALQVRFDLARAQHAAEVQRLESARLTALTRTDALTGLANRRHLDEHLAAAFAAARRAGRPLSVAMVDIDDFKRINDGFGHGVGDTVLRAVAQLLAAQCRAVDLVARFGGEEFCIVFSDADAAHAERACEAAREAIERHDWSALHAALRVTVSAGLADHPAHDSPQALQADADTQLYAAKRSGKNRVVRAA
jgi:diguanylate cyclase (GGDEF)-like protein